MSLGQREKTQQCWISKIPDYPSFLINGSIGVWDPPNCELGQEKNYKNFERLARITGGRKNPPRESRKIF